MLQWRRGNISPQILHILDRRNQIRRASMEAGKYFPANTFSGILGRTTKLLQWRRGNISPQMRPAPHTNVRTTRFNGGGEIFPRKCRHFFMPTRRVRASMEAGKYFPANTPTQRLRIPIYVLQWRRGNISPQIAVSATSANTEENRVVASNHGFVETASSIIQLSNSYNLYPIKLRALTGNSDLT